MRSADYGGVALGVEAAWPAPALRLARGAIVRMRDAAGTTLSAHGGMVWITEEDGVRDVLLRSRQSFTFRRSGLALVEAWTEAVLSFSAGH